jgi:hypothetical protein
LYLLHLLAGFFAVAAMIDDLPSPIAVSVEQHEAGARLSWGAAIRIGLAKALHAGNDFR